MLDCCVGSHLSHLCSSSWCENHAGKDLWALWADIIWLLSDFVHILWASRLRNLHLCLVSYPGLCTSQLRMYYITSTLVSTLGQRSIDLCSSPQDFVAPIRLQAWCDITILHSSWLIVLIMSEGDYVYGVYLIIFSLCPLGAENKRELSVDSGNNKYDDGFTTIHLTSFWPTWSLVIINITTAWGESSWQGDTRYPVKVSCKDIQYMSLQCIAEHYYCCNPIRR